ncbi:formate dehydrogenase subunit gamma [Azoarcus sp. TTM-91]|uniref:formate dehydrogenase subunit gamma n=1 Tax=Azoarcus sp. TTM-91 TaxID=2691581 RepID=UPI0032B84984
MSTPPTPSPIPTPTPQASAASCTTPAGDRLQALVDARKALPGAMLPILHAIQEEFGWVPPEAVPMIASALNLSRAEVYGVLTFYHHFCTQPPGRHVVQVCRAESCQAMGGEGLEAYARATLGVDWHETTADGAVTLLPVYCLGNCACSPAVRVDDDVRGRITPARFDALLAGLRERDAERAGQEVAA